MEGKDIDEKVNKIYNSDIFEQFKKDVKDHVSNQSSGDILQSSYIDEIQNPKPTMTGAHEIVFEIKTIVFKQNEKLENVAAETMNQDRFHIPVPLEVDHTQYAAKIFKKFVDNLVHILANDNEDKDEQQNN